MRRAAAIAGLWLLAAASAGAHPAPFSYLDLRLSDAGIDGSLVLHDLDVAHDVGVDPPERFADPVFAEQYRDQLSRLMDSRLTLFVDGRRVPLTWSGLETLPERQSLRLRFNAADARPGRVRVDAIVFPYDPIHQTFLNVYEDGELRHQAILDQQRTAFDYYAGTWQGATAVMAVFIPAGIEHIVIGPDHVLFLVGLLLLGGTLWRLTTIVTAFTLGHSVTLSLAALDVVSPPAAIVEPVIALSIVFVGADNLLVLRDRARADADSRDTTSPRDIRAWVAGAFGLIHGFGFASVLKGFGLPLTALGWSLFSFNFGVEIGQLAIVFVVAAALAAVRRRDARLARYLVIAGSLVVIAAGTYWFVERVFFS
jgi:hydrogenase/urease accessory protein HupE